MMAVCLLCPMLALAVLPSRDGGQAFRLNGGEFRWIPFTINQTPAEVDCRFEVLKGEASVRAELLPMSEFRLFSHDKPHSSVTGTAAARTAEFRSVLNSRGQYALVIVNEKGAPAATVSLGVEVVSNPNGSATARTLPPERRLTVILLSFAFFFVTVTWSARKLLRAMKQ